MLRSIGARDLMEEVALIDGTALMEEAASATEQVHISQMGLISASDVASWSGVLQYTARTALPHRRIECVRSMYCLCRVVCLTPKP